MGVRGLTTYVHYNQTSLLKHHLLHDSNLVIDGHSLCAQLYRTSNCFSAFGGDYDRFAACVKIFFKNMTKCNITCYVLFDGSYESRKLKTAYSRLRSKIYGASRLDPVTQSSLQIFPLLMRDVFKEILNDMKVQYTICEFEADDEIAALARHLGCPVLSYDSDFFIYNVLYIPFNTLDSQTKTIYRDGIKYNALECKIYQVKHFVDSFGGLKEDMLPLLATLLGNDYVQKKVFNKFFSQLKLPKSKRNKNEQQRSIKALLNWLQNETLESAITKIVGRMKKNDKRKVFKIIKKSIEGYNKTECQSLYYLNLHSKNVVKESDLQITVEDLDSTSDGENNDNKTVTSSSDSEDDSPNISEDGSEDEECASDTSEDLITGLPQWFADGIRTNMIPHAFINLYTLHLHFCSPQAENYNDEDAFLCALPLMRYGFDILTDFSQDSCIYISRERESHYKKLEVGADNSISRPFEENYCDVTDDRRKLYFKHLLDEKMSGLDLSVIDLLPHDFKLTMLSILWWVRTCNVPMTHVHSLFISYIMLTVIDERTGCFRGHFFFNNKHSTKLQELKKVAAGNKESSADQFFNKNKVTYEDCLIAASVLLEHFEISKEMKKKPKSFDKSRVHNFAQFQCCLQQFNCLNNLCNKFFDTTQYSKHYNGTFVYNIASKMDGQIDILDFMEKYIKGAHTVLQLYKSLCSVFNECAEQLGLKTTQSTRKKRRGRKNKNIDEDISFLSGKFESEVII